MSPLSFATLFSITGIHQDRVNTVNIFPLDIVRPDLMFCVQMPPGSRMLVSLAVFGLSLNLASCLDNGLAMTPPMGWLAWERCYNLRNTYF